MCGIIGYVGHRPCIDLIYDGLRRLEYRGYDSAGIAVLKDGRIEVEKAEGKLSALKNLLPRLPADATIGMGHTRWATHGPPNQENAHPHVLQDLAIIHNGIIENYRELKDALIGRGVRFSSDTDTEVALHLLSEKIRATKTVKDALLELVKEIKGAYALTIISAKDPDALYVVKQGSPAVAGLGKGENFVASDALALMPHTNQIVFFNDGEMARLTADEMTLWTFQGKNLKPLAHQLTWTASAIEKGGYRHFMLKEIYDQPTVMASTIERLIDPKTKAIYEEHLDLGKIDVTKITSINIVACGTAYHVGLVGKYFLEPMLKLPVNVELASEFRYRRPHVDKGTLVIAISQSGETIDTLESIKYAADQGCSVYSICNVKYASIPRASHGTLYMEAGPEIGVASTKAFTSQIFNLYIWTLVVGSKRGTVKAAEISEAVSRIRMIPALIDKVLQQAGRIESLAGKYYEYNDCLFIGRGPSCPVAYEGALKLKEISYIHAEAYAGGELKHGPIALVDHHMPLIVVVPQDRYFAKMVSNIEEVRAREGIVVGVCAEDDETTKSLCSDYIPCPQIDTEPLQAILSTIPLQLFAYYVAVKRGTDVDQPRNLAKSVTVE